jgi:hypothetical protein
MWSLGCVIFEVIERMRLFEGLKGPIGYLKIYETINDTNYRMTFRNNTDSILADLANSCLTQRKSIKHSEIIETLSSVIEDAKLAAKNSDIPVPQENLIHKVDFVADITIENSIQEANCTDAPVPTDLIE